MSYYTMTKTYLKLLGRVWEVHEEEENYLVFKTDHFRTALNISEGILICGGDFRILPVSKLYEAFHDFLMEHPFTPSNKPVSVLSYAHVKVPFKKIS
jgi:hypothetical protein